MLGWTVAGLVLAGGAYYAYTHLDEIRRFGRQMFTSGTTETRPMVSELHKQQLQRAQEAVARGENPRQARYAITPPGGVFQTSVPMAV